MYICFVTKNGDLFDFDVIRINSVTLEKGNEALFNKQDHLRNLEGSEIVDTLITNDRKTYLLFRLKWKIREAKSYTLHYKALVESLERRGFDRKVIEDTIKASLPLEELLLREVGRVYARLLEIDDAIDEVESKYREFAIECYNFYVASGCQEMI